jgi:hypothetical protein
MRARRPSSVRVEKRTGTVVVALASTLAVLVADDARPYSLSARHGSDTPIVTHPSITVKHVRAYHGFITK